MSNLVNEQLVNLNVKVDTWQQALEESCRSLMENNFVSRKYLDLLIDVVNETGPYFILLEGFALPHVSASDEVKKTGLSITTLNKPIEFENGKKVKVLFTLACKDNQEHLGMLMKLSTLLQKENFVEKIYAAKTIDEIKSLMEEK